MIIFSKFSPKAMDFIKNSDARINIAHGAVRSSKTVNCTVRWLDYIASGPPGDLLMSGKTIATLQRNVLNDIRDIVGEANFKWVNKQQGELTLFGRRVYCVGASNEDAESKIRGATLAGAYCDEVSLYPESFFIQLMARLSVPGAMCFCNCNPDSPYHWFYRGYIINDAVTNKKVWHFLMEDNLSLDEEYMTSLKQMYFGVFYKRLILGEWVMAEGVIYDMFDADIHVKKIEIPTPDNIDVLEMQLPPGQRIDRVMAWVIGCDYATSSVMTWSLIACFESGKMYKRAEYYYDVASFTNPVQQTDSEFLVDFQNWLKQYPEVDDSGGINIIYVDPSASSWKLELIRAGYKVANAKNDVINGIRVVGNMLKNGLYYIDPTCENTIMEYGTYSWDPRAQRLGIDKPLEIKDHSCDADRYALYTFARNSLSGVY